MTDICLVSMPYSSLNGPSIALGLLKGALKGTEIEVSVLYPNIWFAEEIGLGASQMCKKRGRSQYSSRGFIAKKGGLYIKTRIREN